jgi:FkbM family methyltransferase
MERTGIFYVRVHAGLPGRANVKAPAWDKGFPFSGMHGTEAQQELIRRATRYVSQTRTAIDVGAHIGLTALALAKQFSVVHAFEPVEENFLCFVANTGFCDNINAYNVALSAKNGEPYEMRLPEKGNSGCWYLESSGQRTARTLDSYNFDHVDFIKLDVEGSEGFVLEGAVRLLKRCLPAVLFEDNGLGQKYYGAAWVDPKSILAPLGYAPVMKIHKNEVWA